MRVAVKGLLPLLVAGLLATGCGGDDGDGNGDGDGDGGEPQATSPAAPPADPATGQAAGPDPCTLLDDATVAAAVGADVTRTEGPREEHLAQACYWYFPDQLLPGEDGEASAHVWVGEEFYAPTGDTAGMTDFTELSGIGDLAHQWPPVAGICTVIFTRGDLVVQVSTLGAAGDDDCVGLAREADGRL